MSGYPDLMHVHLRELYGKQVNVVPVTTLPYRGRLEAVCDDYIVVNTGHPVAIPFVKIVAVWEV